MQVNDEVFKDGYITKALYLRMQSPREVERRLGFRTGRLDQGYWLLFLEQRLVPSDFEFRGYTQMSGGVSQGHEDSPPDPRNAEQRLRDDGYDLLAMKERIVRDVFKYSGAERLAKVIPRARAFGDKDYPQGDGIPQWEITRTGGVRFRVAAALGPNEVYRGNYT